MAKNSLQNKTRGKTALWHLAPLSTTVSAEQSERLHYLKSMASHRGQNRYSDFVALETLLRFENCSSSHCLLSSWRRFHVFESSHPSFHRSFSSGQRWLFFVAPLWAYVVVASFLCLRVVGSSFRLRYIRCTDFTYLVTLLPYCSVPLLLCCHFLNFSIFLHDRSQFFFRIDAFFWGGGGGGSKLVVHGLHYKSVFVQSN